MTVWGWAPNGRDIALGINIWREPDTVTFATESVNLFVEFRIKCNFPTWDTSNQLQWAGYSEGIITNPIRWSSSRTVNDEVIHGFVVNVPLIRGQDQHITYHANLSGLGTAGGTMSVSATGYIPARPYGAGQVQMSSTNFTMGTPVTITANRPDPSMRVKFKWLFGYANGYAAGSYSSTEVRESATWTPPIGEMGPQIPSSPSGTGTMICYYYDAAGNYTGESSVPFTAHYPAGAAYTPTPGTVSLSEGDSIVRSVMGTMSNRFVQNVSKLYATFSGEAGVHGSRITNVSFTWQGNQYNNLTSPWTSPAISSSGSHTLVKTVTDSRGRSASTSLGTTVLPYAAPSITKFTVARADASGADIPSGVYANVIALGTLSSLVNGTEKNTATVRVQSRQRGDTAWTTLLTAPYNAPSFQINSLIDSTTFFANKSYDFQLVVTDKFQSTSRIEIMPTEFIPLAVGKTGIGVGKAWERGSVDAADRIYDKTGHVMPPGSVIAFAGASAPVGFLLANGAAVSRLTYADLFAVIGTTYGAGDGSSTFNLPMLVGATVVGRDAGQVEFNTLGKRGGSKTHTLTTAEMPSHTHRYGWGGMAATGPGTGGMYEGEPTATRDTSAAGGGGAHNNLQPYTVLNYVIKT